METRNTKSVLVTGASGFIGQHLVRRLIERGDRVSCLVRATSRTDELQSSGAQLIVGDATDRAGMERALAESQAGVVFHLAGLVKTVRTADFTRVNASGVESVAAASANRAERPVLIVVSSLAAAGPCAGNQPRVEADSPVPVSAYGHSKLAGEQAAAKYAGEMAITIVRPPIVFGPGDRGVLEMFRSIAQSGIHVVPGLKERCVSLIHVADLVALLLLAAEKGERLHPDGVTGKGVYFAAAEHDLTYPELGQAIAKALGKRRARVLHMPAPLVRLAGLCGDLVGRVRQQPCWVNSNKMTEALAGSWTCSSAKARTQLGWIPAATLPERLHETAQWYRQAGWL